MPDMEKVIKAIKCCLTLDSPCGDCPYYSYEYIQELDCERKLRNDAIAMMKEHDELLHKKQHDVDRLCNEISEWKHKFHDKLLKEQEAVEPYQHDAVWLCGNCTKEVVGWTDDITGEDIRYPFCRQCGRAVKWK